LSASRSRVAVWRNGHPEIIPDEEGNRSFASYVSFSRDGRLVGGRAKLPQSVNPKNTIFGVKRVLGHGFRDLEIQEDIRKSPFRYVSIGGVPHIEVEVRDRKESFAPEEIIAVQLSKMVRMAEAYTGEKVHRAVVSIPPGFSRIQRQAVQDACEIAGLEEPYLLGETSAAVVYYGSYSWTGAGLGGGGEKRMLVIDVGAGTTSVSAMVTEEGVVEVVSASSTELIYSAFCRSLTSSIV
ncbi:70 kd heat-shock protein, partial [Ephemerocybe angulata]